MKTVTKTGKEDDPPEDAALAADALEEAFEVDELLLNAVLDDELPVNPPDVALAVEDADAAVLDDAELLADESALDDDDPPDAAPLVVSPPVQEPPKVTNRQITTGMARAP
jgi:hypothetical protein